MTLASKRNESLAAITDGELLKRMHSVECKKIILKRTMDVKGWNAEGEAELDALDRELFTLDDELCARLSE